VLIVLMANPFQKGLVEEIETLCKMVVQVAISKPSEINRALDRLKDRHNSGVGFVGN